MLWYCVDHRLRLEMTPWSFSQLLSSHCFSLNAVCEAGTQWLSSLFGSLLSGPVHDSAVCTTFSSRAESGSTQGLLLIWSCGAAANGLSDLLYQHLLHGNFCLPFWLIWLIFLCIYVTYDLYTCKSSSYADVYFTAQNSSTASHINDSSILNHQHQVCRSSIAVLLHC